jgi:Flp pilus assembly protein TadG
MRDVASLSEFLRNRNGSMAVEFVAFAPLLIAALIVSFEFGRAFWAYDVVTRDVRAGVRYLARSPTAPSPPNCPTAAENIAQTGLYTSGLDANKHFPWKGVTATFTCTVARSFATPDYNDAGQVITMTANVPITLTLLQVLNRLSQWVGSVAHQSAGPAIPTSYSLTVSYEARYIGN